MIAAASNAAQMVREGGGFVAEADDPIMTAQVQLVDVADRWPPSARIEARGRRDPGAWRTPRCRGWSSAAAARAASRCAPHPRRAA